ncbi:Fur family ferric uptake transcriptional regulator [Desulfitispora alkaliphila]|uniref:Fur family transcriptional regulator n=1 Tax=Desulfitispora alkaliphila TaxID=622674 RepID=UPI003D20D50E
MKLTLEEICEKLHQNDYKITPQRQIILKIFLENAEQHLSAEEVYAIVRDINPDVGLATVYRTLDLLAELEILQKVNFGDGKSRYEFSDLEVHHHHHLICVKCGKVTEFDDDQLETLEKNIAQKSNFKIIDHQLKFFGYCSNCQT